MNLKSFGCSFIFGTDLADTVAVPGKTIIPSQHTWPAIIANKFGYQYECFARPGSGNLQIAEQILNQASESSDSLFVISWSWIDRFDHYEQTVKVPIWINDNQWQTICPTDDTKLAKTYYHNLHSEYRDKLTTLMSIKLVIDTLKQKNINFIMTHVDDLMFNRQWHTTLAVLDLQDYINSYITTFEGQPFLDWSRKHGYPESATWHPLETAHESAADYIVRNIKF